MSNTSGGLNVSPRVITAVLVVFVAGWFVSLGAEIFRPGYSAPTGLNECMIALVTAFFVAQQRLSKPEEKKNENESTTEGSE